MLPPGGFAKPADCYRIRDPWRSRFGSTGALARTFRCGVRTNTNRVNDAQCKGKGKRTVRRRPEAFQALLREGRRALRSAPPGVLRKADRCPQAQSGSRREAPREEA